jgi:hypothetical protein
MSEVLVDLLRQMHLKPGESRRVWVDDYWVEIRRLDKEASDVKPDIWLHVPPSDQVSPVTVTPTKAQLPRPYKITDSDPAPE